MAGTNDFKAFATDANANVTSQEEWEMLTALKKGFSSGKASSAQVSKALRQPSTMAAVLGQFIANAELDALDDGDVDGLVAKLATAITTNLGLGEAAKRNVGNGQNQIPDMAAFASSLSSTGFQKLPSGLIIQWGIVNGASNYTVTYPVTFPNRSLALLAVPHTTSVAGISAMGIANCSDISKSQFYIIVGGISRGEIVKYERSCFWVAIGV